MKKVKSFFAIFFNSLLPQDRYYQKIVHSKFNYSLKYYLSFLSLINFVYITILVTAYLSPFKIINTVFDIKNRLQTYPPGLSMTLRNGNLTTTLDSPYFVWSDKRSNLFLVVDEFSAPQKIKEYQSQVMLTGKEIVFYDNKQITTYPYNNSLKIDVNQTSVQKLGRSLNIFLVTYPYLFFVLFILGYLIFNLISLGINFAMIAVASLLVLTIYKLLKKKFAFHKVLHIKKIIQIGLHAITLPIILDYIFSFSNFSRILPLTYLVLIIIFTFTGIYEAYFDHQ